MRSLHVSDTGKTRLVELDPAPLQDDQIRVAIEAAPLNSSDFLAIDGFYPLRPVLPGPVGSEGVGRVLEVAPGVEAVAVGDRVLVVPGSRFGTWQDQLVLDTDQVVRVHREVDPRQLATVGINAATARLLVDHAAGLPEGTWIAQTAANSNLGEFIIALASRAGLRTLNVVRRPTAVEHVLANGGDVVVVDGDDLDAQVEKALRGRELGLILDGVGGKLPGRLAPHLAVDGTILSYAALSGRGVEVRPLHAIFRNVSVRGFWLNNWLVSAPAEEIRTLYAGVIDLVADGVLRSTLAATYDLADWRQAIEHGRRYERSGKVLFTPAP